MRRFWRRRSDDDFSRELQAHLDLETERLLEQGMSPEDAHAAARRAFGNLTIARERFHESRRWIWIEQFGQDLRYAWRTMRQSPAFVVTTVMTLAVGLGLLTVAFTVFNAYILRPYAIRDPYSLHQIVWHSRGSGGPGFTWREYDELSQRSDLFTGIVGEDTRFVSSKGRPLLTAIVSLNYFDTLGPAMLLGRGLSSIDANPADGNPAVITEVAWARAFDRDPAVIGRELDLNGTAYTIVGVLGPAFVGLADAPKDVFVPATAEWRAPSSPGVAPARETEVCVRLRPDVTRAQAEAALLPFMTRTIENQQDISVEVRPQPSPNTLSVPLIAVLSPVFAAFVLVLVTACANVSNVMLARAVARHREIAVRLSIGASRGRIVRQMLTEGLLLAMLSGLAALVLASWGIRFATIAFTSTLPPSVVQIVRLAPMTFDYRVFTFALAVAAATTMVFALIPALQSSRVSLLDIVRGQGGGGRSTRLRNTLVISQVAVAIVLVITAVTLARNGTALGRMSVGFHTEGLYSVNVRGPQDELARPLAKALAADPRVQELAVTSGNPLFNHPMTVSAGPVGGVALRTRLTFVSPEFFPILRLPIARGRTFTAEEARGSARVAIISAAAARVMWPGQDPLGKTITIERPNGRPVEDLPDYPEVTVIGTVPDIVAGMLLMGLDRGRIYLPMTAESEKAMAILVRGRTARDLSDQAFQQIFRSVAKDPEVFEVIPLEEMRKLQVYPIASAGWVGIFLGAVALILSVSGLYGSLAYALSQRRKEIGIRMALGASARAVVRLVLGQSIRLAAIGTLIGIVVAFATLKILSSLVRLQTLTLVDAVAFVVGVILVAVATLFASYEPARRASRVDPARTLRADA